MRNALELYNDHVEDALFAFRGEDTSGLLDAVFHTLHPAQKGDAADFRLKKKVNNIIIECLQNIHHHTKDPQSREVVFLVNRYPDGYQVITGNTIPASEANSLQNKIDRVNSLTETELRDHYLEALRTAELSGKGGAGLGIIQMARFSGNKIEYRFDPQDPEHTYFSLQVNISSS